MAGDRSGAVERASRSLRTRLNGDERAYVYATGALTGALVLSALAHIVFEEPQPTLDILIYTAARVVLGAVVVIAAVTLRERLPAWLGAIGALTPAVMLALFAVFGTDTAHTLLCLREFPIIALYLGWFFPSWFARLSVYPVVVTTIAAATLRGLPAVDGALTPIGVAEFTIFSVLCLVLGMRGSAYYRRRSDGDPLTGVLNRRGLRRAGLDEVRRAHRRGEPLTVVLVDADRLKAVNDADGHHAGDTALQELAHHLGSAIRDTDLVGRVGGDEFVLLLSGTDARTARSIMARVHRTSPVPFSYGIAERSPADDLDALIRRADERMYGYKS
ncbi:diguanylate cyclase [Microbacterium sp. ZW T5_56]|uniref:GGDEF domain-containing protein n=1 Tax=Microbacterium sp. ZW T5_56 TaxID=3378081 RepID=UPI00385322DA